MESEDEFFDGEILEDEGIQEEILDGMSDLVASGDVILDQDQDEDLDDEMEEDEEEVPNDAKLTLQYHTDAVYCVALKEQDDQIIIGTGGGDEIGTIFETLKSTLEQSEGNVIITNPQKELKGHSDSITCVAWNFDKSILATGGMDGMVQLWKPNGELIVQLQGPAESIDWLDWHPRGNVVVCGSSDGTGWMWNTAGTCLNVFSGHDGPVTCGRFTPNGKLLITGSRDESIKIWAPTQGTTQQNITGDLFHQAPVISFDCTDSVVASGGENGTLRLSNYTTGKILSKYEDHGDSVESIQFCPILPVFTSASLDGTLKIWDLNSGQLRSTVLAHEGGVTNTKIHQTEPLLFSCGVDGTIKVWDIRSSTCTHTFRGHTKPVLDMDISMNGRILLSCSDDQTARLFFW